MSNINNTTKVHFAPDQDYIWKIQGLEQWDKCQKLEISGLNISDETVEVHFSLEQFQGTAKRMPGVVKDGVIYTDIPAFVLEGPEYIYENSEIYNAYAWVYVSDEESAETIRKMEFEIKARSKPEDYVTPDELSFLQQLEQAMKNKLNKSGYAPNKYLGTDTEGNVVEKNAPEGGEVSDEQVAQAVEEYLTKTGSGGTQIVNYGESVEDMQHNIEQGKEYACNFKVGTEAGLYDSNGNLLCTEQEMRQQGMISAEIEYSEFYEFNDDIMQEKLSLTQSEEYVFVFVEGLYYYTGVLASNYIKHVIYPCITDLGCDPVMKNGQTIYTESTDEEIASWKDNQGSSANVVNIENFDLFTITDPFEILLLFSRMEDVSVEFSRFYRNVEYIARYDGEIWASEIRKGDVPTKTSDLINDSFIESPTTAEVGQILVVKVVDENGVPTEWEVKNSYTSEEIDQKFGTYVDEMAELLGGDA